MRSIRQVLLGLIGVLALMGAPASADEKAAGEKEAFGRLSVDEVQKLVDAKSVAVFDNNGEERFKKGHVPGARWVRPSELKGEDLGGDKAKKLVFYCGNEKCSACHTAAKKAIELGYTNVFIMPAGIAGWEQAGKPVEKI